MTVAELERYMNGAIWRLRVKAQFDYRLADLIGASCGRLFSSDVKYPTLEESYDELFKGTDEQQAQREEQEALEADIKSMNVFLQFAAQHNTKK